MNRFNLPVAGLSIQLGITLLVTVLQNRVNTPRYGKAALSGKERPQPAFKRRRHCGLYGDRLVLLFTVPVLSLVSRL